MVKYIFADGSSIGSTGALFGDFAAIVEYWIYDHGKIVDIQWA